ncbi:MAG: hypothetical protein AB7P69_17890 [Candidatus Binatia bacterium]
METGLTAVKQTGAAIGQPRYLTVLAEACAAAGQTDKALSLLSQAEQRMTITGEYFYAAELHRLRGEIMLRQSHVLQGPTPNLQSSTLKANNIPQSVISNPQLEAEARFQKAIEIARQQRARSFELRAVMSLCRLRQLQGRGESARQSLRKIYDWFQEGFDTPDLRAARELLAELNQQAA